MKHRTPDLLHQKGSMMIEALVAILIFSMGILAMMGLQAASVKLSSDAKYRSDASLLANELIGQMWVSDRTPATLIANFKCTAASSVCSSGSRPTLVNNWINNDVIVLPGTAATPPIVSVVTQPPTTSGAISNLVTVTIFWKAPNDPALPNGSTLCGVTVNNANYAHCFIAMAQII